MIFLLEEKKKIKTDAASTEEPSSEVFDSSTYNSMTDLNASATMSKSNVNKVLSDANSKQPIEPGAVHVEYSTNARSSPGKNTVAPTMEGRAYALKKARESQNNKSMSKQLDKQTDQANKKITQMLQPLQKHVKSLDKQSELIKQIQSQLKQLQKQVSQIQRAINIGKKKKT
jgi:hypothetical protein